MLFIYLILHILNLPVLAMLFQWAILLSAIGIILACQNDIKKFLESLGSKDLMGFKNLIHNKSTEKDKLFSDKQLKAFLHACDVMSEAKTGALIVFEVDTPLQDIIQSGIQINGDISSALLINTFEKNTPLHDGAVVIRDNKLAQATCYLPLSDNSKINKSLGTRHRAAIGVTEQTDAVALVVQEETGAISVARDGKIKHKLSLIQLEKKLQNLQLKYKTANKINLDKKDIKVRTIVNNSRIKLQNNLIMKITQLGLQIIAWFMIINIIDPVQTKVFNDIPVEIVNSDVIQDLGQTFTVSKGSTVSITVSGRRSEIDRFTSKDIKATQDLQNLSITNQVMIDVKTNPEYSSIQVKGIDTPNMVVNLEDIAEVELPITLLNTGEPSTGFYLNDLKSDITTLQIKGPVQKVKNIDKVIANIDITDKYDKYTTQVIPVLIDKNGDELDISKFQLSSDSIQVTAYMYKTKEIPLSINLLKSDSQLWKDFPIIIENYDMQLINPDDTSIMNSGVNQGTLDKFQAIISGWKISKVNLDDGDGDKDLSVVVQAPNDVLDTMNELELDFTMQIDTSSIANNKIVKVINIQELLPEGVYLAQDTKTINATITLEKVTSQALNVDTLIQYGVQEDEIISKCESTLASVMQSKDTVNSESASGNDTDD